MLVFYHAGFPLLLSNAHSLLLALTALNIYQVGLLNVDGFYDPFLSFIDMAVSEGFIAEDARRIIISAPTARELVLKLEEYVPEYEVGLVWDDQMPHSFAPDLETRITSS